MYCQGPGEQTGLVVAASLSPRYWPLQIELHSERASHAQLHCVPGWLHYNDGLLSIGEKQENLIKSQHKKTLS